MQSFVRWRLPVVIHRKKIEEKSFLALLLSPLLKLVRSDTMYAETKVSARKQDLAEDRIVFAYSDSSREAQ